MLYGIDESVTHKVSVVTDCGIDGLNRKIPSIKLHTCCLNILNWVPLISSKFGNRLIKTDAYDFLDMIPSIST